MPKLVYTHQDARELIADKHNVGPENVTIEPEVAFSSFPALPPSVPTYVSLFRDFLLAANRNGNDMHNKIGMIKAVRSITGLGLKEAKDIVEGI